MQLWVLHKHWCGIHMRIWWPSWKAGWAERGSQKNDNSIFNGKKSSEIYKKTPSFGVSVQKLITDGIKIWQEQGSGPQAIKHVNDVLTTVCHLWSDRSSTTKNLHVLGLYIKEGKNVNEVILNVSPPIDHKQALIKMHKQLDILYKQIVTSCSHSVSCSDL